MKTTQKRQINLILITALILIVGLILYILAKVSHPVPCLFHKITGLQCPGCGNTRAILALLELDIMRALSYNYLFPVCAFYLCFVYFHCAITYYKTGKFTYRTPAPVMDIAILVSLVIWWIVRNILHI